MHILIVTQYFWPENFKINDLTVALKQLGHEVTIFTGKPNYPSGKFERGYGFWSRSKETYHDCEVIRVPLIPRGKGGSIELIANFASFAMLASLIAPFRCRGNYDIIFVYEPSPITVGLPAIVIKKLIKKPMLLWVQDLWPETLFATGALKSKRLLDMVGKMVRFIYKHCDSILIQSIKFRLPIENMGVSSDRIHFFPNWAEPFYKPLSVPKTQSARLLPEGFNILFAGNFGVAQDFSTTLAAAESLKTYSDINWILIGDGRMKAWLENEIAERGLRHTVFLLDKQPPEAMPHYFAQADVLLVTLKKNPIMALTLPSKLQSYMACAKPVVAALEGEGNRILQEAGAGIGCASGDSASLASAVLTLYRMPSEDREEMGRRGRIYYDTHFERTMLVDKLVRWMEQLKNASTSSDKRAIL